MGIKGGRLCSGEASRGDIGCPAYAPSLTTAGDVSVTGNLSAAKFMGDGSALTGINTSVSVTTGLSGSIVFRDEYGYLKANNSFYVSNSNVFLGAVPSWMGAYTNRIWAENGLYTNNYIRTQNDSRIGFGDVTSYMSGSDGVTGNIRFVVSNTEALRIVSTGFVGIGTTTPSGILHINEISNPAWSTASLAANVVISGNKNPALALLPASTYVSTVSPVAIFNGNNGLVIAKAPSIGDSASNITTLLSFNFNQSNVANFSNNVGIRTGGSVNTSTALHVSGTLRIANGGEACDTNRAGGIRYQGGSFDFCDGVSGWQSLAAVAGAGATAPDRIVSGTSNATIDPAGNVSMRGRLDIVTGTNVVAVGYRAGQFSTARNLTALGYHGGRNNTAHTLTALGMLAGENNSGISSTLVGSYAGQFNTGTGVTALGHTAAQSNTAPYVVALGTSSGQFNTGNNLTALGHEAGQYNTATHVTAVGYIAAQSNTAPYIAAMGNYAAQYNTGQQLTAVGYQTAKSNTAPYVTALGAYAGQLNTFSNVTLLGYNVQADKDNQVVLGNGSVVEVSTSGVYLGAGLKASGIVTATYFEGDGSRLTGINTTGDRIISGTTSVSAQTGGVISITTSGVTANYFNASGLLVTPGISVTTANGVSSTNGYFSGNVGIGVSSPTLTLDVSGSLRTAAHYNDNNPASIVFLKTRNSNAVQSGDRLMGLYSNGSYGSGISGNVAAIEVLAAEPFTPTANGTAIRIGTTPVGATTRLSRMYIGPDGNVGIGTTVPSNALQVYGGTTSSSIALSRADSPANFLKLTYEGPEATIGTTGNDGLSFQTVGTTRMTIHQAGRIGIGTTTPIVGLHILGDGGSMDDVVFEANTDTATNSALLALYRSRGTETSKTAIVTGDLLGTIRFVGHNGSGYATGGAISSYAEGNFDTAGTRSSYMSFFTVNAGSQTEKMRILANGNLGIGTTSPAVTLHVSGTLRVQNGSVVTCNIGTGTGATSCTSDGRLKKDITPIAGALEKITKLNGVTFRWKAKDAPQGEHIGVIAQDVEKVFPQAVDTMETGTKSVDYGVLVAPLIEAVKELKSENAALKAANDNLRLRLDRLEARGR